MEEKYGEKNTKEWMELLKKISILLEVKFDSKSKKNMIEMKKEITEKLKQIEDNQLFVKFITNEKKDLTQEIKKIDETVNNKQMLQAEYVKRNENIPIEKKIFSDAYLFTNDGKRKRRKN